MSFIVHGVKIPVSCDSCPLMRWIDYGIDGELQYCNILHAICEHEEGQRDADCPLVEVEEAEESDDCLTNFLIAIAKEREREKDETIGEVRIGNYRVTGNRFRQVWRYEPEGDKE